MNAASPREYAEGAARRSELWLVEIMSRLPFYHLSQMNGNVVVCTRRDPSNVSVESVARSGRRGAGREVKGLGG